MADSAPPRPPAGDAPPPPAHAPHEEPPPPTVNTADNYCGRFRLNPRFVVTTAVTARPLISVPINMMALMNSCLTLLTAAYVDWSRLRGCYSGDPAAITAAIQAGCTEMAKAFVLMIYNMLRYKCSVHDSQNQNIYRSRCYLDIGTEIPSGLATMVELFGYARPDQNHYNETFLHRWDHQNHGDNEFGIPVANRLNSHILDGFISQLVAAGVPTRRVDRYCAPRNLWDSLLVVERTGGHDVYTTFANVNYVLPKDVFYAIGICNASTLVPARPVQFYPPRIAVVNDQNANIRVKGLEPNEATNAERAAMPALGANAHATDAQLRINGRFPNMHLTGTERYQTGIDAANGNAPVYAERMWIYGRGGAQQALVIDCVARGVTNEEVYGFFRSLLRHG